MIISDLNYLEVAEASEIAGAKGKQFAGNITIKVDQKLTQKADGKLTIDAVNFEGDVKQNVYNTATLTSNNNVYGIS